MQPKTQRRMRGAEFKAQVLAECQEPGASVAAVALAHGLWTASIRMAAAQDG
jgi:transposase